MAGAYPTIEHLVPHGQPSRLVEEVEEASEGGVVCRARIPVSSPFVRGAGAPSFVGLEIGAQAAAVVEALSRIGSRDEGPPRIGYLVGVRDAVFHAPELPAERPLLVSARPSRRSGALSVYEIAVSLDDRILVEATIETTLPDAATGDLDAPLTNR